MARGVKQQQDHYEAQLEEAHNEVEELKFKLEVKRYAVDKEDP